MEPPTDADGPSEGTDPMAATALGNWRPRYRSGGVTAADLDEIESSVEEWAQWCPTFCRLGERFVDLGEAAEDRGDTETAGEHFTRAAMYHHYGSHVWHVDAAERDAAHRRAVDLFRRGGAHLDPPLQRIEAPYDAGGFDAPGNLRVPDRGPEGSAGDSPLVLVLPGLDSIKEERFTWDPVFHRRGLATLAIEGPGQGEVWHEMGMSPAYPGLFSAVIDHVIDLDPPGVDTSRIGVLGSSLGGFYAALGAANDDRIDACVSVSGPFTVGPVSTRQDELVSTQYRWACKVDSDIEVDEITESMTLRDDIADLTAPTLVVTGARDTIVPPVQSRRIAERAPEAEFRLFEDGRHSCNNIAHLARPVMVDWLRRQLG